jgi:hypothetical protein
MSPVLQSPCMKLKHWKEMSDPEPLGCYLPFLKCQPWERHHGLSKSLSLQVEMRGGERSGFWGWEHRLGGAEQ